MSVTGVDRPTGPDTVPLEVTRSDPACHDPNAGCPGALPRGFIEALVANGEVRIHLKLRRSRVAATITFVNEVSGTSCATTIGAPWANLPWRARTAE